MELTREQKVLQQVISEAWNNPSFKQELIKSPAAAIKKLTGVYFTLPLGKRLEVIDQSNTDVIYLNIPAQPNMNDYEIANTDLEVATGGNIPWIKIKNLFPSGWPNTTGSTSSN